jgi:hypothetical protein
MSTDNSYRALLNDGKFEAFLWTQFLGAFNDNVYKIIVSIMAVRIAADSASSSRYLAIAGAVFVIPFLLFAGYAGQLADRYSKTMVLQVTKSFEVITMLVGIVALVSGRIEVLLAVLFLLATQANFFSPAKYGILPEITTEAGISRANGLLELTTFAAIVLREPRAQRVAIGSPGASSSVYGDGSGGTTTGLCNISANTDWTTSAPKGFIRCSTFTVATGITLHIPGETFIHSTGTATITGGIIVDPHGPQSLYSRGPGEGRAFPEALLGFLPAPEERSCIRDRTAAGAGACSDAGCYAFLQWPG